MTTPLTKLIAENKERPIAEAPRDGSYVLISGGVCQSVCFGGDEWVPFVSTYLACKYDGDDFYTVNDYFYVKPTHFRPLPDDRLADAFELIMEHIKAAIEDLEEDGGYDAEAILKEGIRRVTAIAEGKDNADK